MTASRSKVADSPVWISCMRRMNRSRFVVAIAAVVAVLLFSVVVIPQRGSAYSSIGQPGDDVDVVWGLAPSWPFRGVVAHYGYEPQYRPWLEYRYTDRLGLQFLDTERSQVSYVLLDHFHDSNELICAWTRWSHDAEGITWILHDGTINRGRRSWYVPWGDFAYPLFLDDLENEVESKIDVEYDPDYSSFMVTIGTDGRSLRGWRSIHSEPACGGDLVFVTDARTGDAVACGWSWASAFLVDPAVRSAAASYWPVSVSPDAPYETCGLLDLRRWRQALGEQDGL